MRISPRSMLTALAFAGALAASPAFALTDAECEANWTKLDAAGAGYVTPDQAASIYAGARVAGQTPGDRVTKQQYLDWCKAGHFNLRATDAGAPLKGANSFTEKQAQDRAVAAGFANVSAMTKDADGIWRGKGTANGKESNVAVDFKGNVVAQ
mgnify:FL=1